MFENHFALRENPFVSGHQPRFVFPSPEHQEALAHLRFGIENREPFVLITGEVGTGKTTALYDVLGEWKERVHVALINNSALTRSELLEEICLRLGFTLPPGSSKPQVLNQLERHLLAVHGRGERAILLFDEAQNLDRDLLEEIRLLSNLESQGDKLLQVFLVGQPELEERLSRPELRQLRQRISVHYRLKPMTLEDTERYIHHRVTVAGGYAPAIFPAESCRVVFDLSHGIPREINHICAQAMLGAFVDESPTVEPEHVRAAAAEIEFKSVMRYGAEEPAEPRPARIERRRLAPAPEPSRAAASEPPATAAAAPPPMAGPPAAASIAAAPVTPASAAPAAIAPAPVEAQARPEPPAHAAPAEPPPPPAVSATPPSIARREPERFTPHTPPRPRSVEHRPPPFVPPTLRPSPSTVEDIEAENGSSKTLGWMLAI
ncbi:MAG TPA: AAA family ATPase, partial [Candidatus Eisenbacteria bacterium]